MRSCMKSLELTLISVWIVEHKYENNNGAIATYQGNTGKIVTLEDILKCISVYKVVSQIFREFRTYIPRNWFP